MRNNIYLTGAGFTKAIIKTALLADDIMNLISISSMKEIKDIYDNSFPDIELFITKIDLEYLNWRNKNIDLANRFKEIRQNITNEITNLFSIDNLCIDNLENHLILNKFISSVPKNSTIMTINYDCILDQGLWLSERWHPKGGYYFPSYTEVDENELKDKIILLKLHGSINFGIRDTDYLENKDNFYYIISDKIFKNIHSSWNVDNHTNPYALIMSYIKPFNNQIYFLWDKAIEDFSKADTLTIIGCGLRDEDKFLEFAIKHFGQKENTDQFIINIVDISTDQRKRIENKLFGLVGNPGKVKVVHFSSLEDYVMKQSNA